MAGSGKVLTKFFGASCAKGCTAAAKLGGYMPAQRIDQRIRLWDLVRLEAFWAVRSISSNPRGAGAVLARQVKQCCGG